MTETTTAASSERCVVRGVREVIVFVDDLEAATEFYVGKLGLEKRGAGEPAPKLRTVEVSAPGGATSIMLVRPSLEAMGAAEASRAHERVGEPTGVVLEVESLEEARLELERRGVELAHGPSWQSLGGRVLWVRDPSDNELMLVEAAASS